MRAVNASDNDTNFLFAVDLSGIRRAVVCAEWCGGDADG